MCPVMSSWRLVKRGCGVEVGKKARIASDTAKGLWFMKVNVVRDAYAVNNHETSERDRWRDAPSALRSVPPEELPQLDYLSLHPESPVGDIAPSWLRD